MRGRVLVLVTSCFAGLVIMGSSIFFLINSGVRVPNSVLLGLRIATPPLDNKDHLYVLDGWGGVHPLGKAPALSTSVTWPTKDIAFSLALFPDGTGGYVMDGWGQLHPVGSAPKVDSHVYWPHWIGAREIVMAPWSSSARPAGYLLDADGAIHPFGGAPAITGNAFWPSQGIARGIVLTPESTPRAVAGYTLDGFGGVHPFGGARPVVGATHWSTDVARGIVLIKGSNGLFVDGYTLDYSGGIHPFGGAPAVKPSATWPGQDMADSIVAWSAAPPGVPGGWVLDRQGDVHSWGSAPSVLPSKTWPGWDIARGLAGAGSGGGSTERTILDAQPLSNDWGSYFNQRDDRWASADVGAASYPVWEIGCLLSDLAMVYSHFGFRSVTPATIAAHTEWFNRSGAIFNSALRVPGHTTSIVDNPDSAWIRAQVAAGHPVVVGMNLPSGTTHFVTLTGLAGDSDYWVNDPWEQNAMHVSFSGDWFTRGPIYEAIVFD
jgi:Papain-like cysteine protease AvrRpt2